MSDLRIKGDVPISPRDRHSQNIGTGNYNRFAPLLPPPPGRGRLNSKRKYDEDQPPVTPKAPRLDANVVFSQLKNTGDAVFEIRKSLSDAIKVGESCYSANDGGMGEAFFKLTKTLDLIIENQEKVLSTVVDAMGVIDKNPPSSSYAAAVNNRGKNSASGRAVERPEPDPAETCVKKLRQAIAKAERSVTLFDLDLGSVPVLNRETLNRKVTLLLHDRAQKEGMYKGNPSAAEEAVDDILSCATIDILGKGTCPFYNKKDASDPRNGKMCTVPIKLTFKDKATRFQAELSLKKVCKARCGTPYPKELRVIMDGLVKDCKAIKPGSFILAKVDADKLLITARARSNKGWEDINRSVPIPENILDQVETTPEDEMTEMVSIS